MALKKKKKTYIFTVIEEMETGLLVHADDLREAKARAESWIGIDMGKDILDTRVEFNQEVYHGQLSIKEVFDRRDGR